MALPSTSWESEPLVGVVVAVWDEVDAVAVGELVERTPIRVAVHAAAEPAGVDRLVPQS
ncbi:hypothetical protein ACWDKQ_11730 [Saccharopolyspora sp. NPDC000995]